MSHHRLKSAKKSDIW